MEPENRQQLPLIEQVDAEIQADLNTLMDVMEENQTKIPEGEYLRGMNALGSLHKHSRTKLSARRFGFGGGGGTVNVSMAGAYLMSDSQMGDFADRLARFLKARGVS